MNANVLKTQVLSSLLAGTGRQPMAGVPGPHVELNALSLVGQALRFERPVSPPSFAVEVDVVDGRMVLPDALRRPLLRLVTGKLATEHAPLAIAHVFDRLRLRPHPFDLPRMDHFVRTYAEQLGTTAQSWARPKDQAAAEANYYFDDEVLTDDNWTYATTGRRAAYLSRRRSQDGAAALVLLEAAWGQFDPDGRLRMLQALEPTLEIGDMRFLDSLEKDRAPRVRAFALRLLSRLGGDAKNPALTELVGRIRRTEAGLLRRRTVLTLELPATVKEQAAPMWLREAFAEVSFDELRRAFSLTEFELIGAAAKDGNLLLGLALAATADLRLDLLQTLVADHLPSAWELFEQSGLHDLGLMSGDERDRWAMAIVAPYGRKLPQSYLQWSWLHRVLRQPGPPALLQAVLASDWLETLPDLEKQGAAWMEVLAALCPPQQRGPLRARMMTFDSALSSTALPLLDMLDAMETVRPHA